MLRNMDSLLLTRNPRLRVISRYFKIKHHAFRTESDFYESLAF
ncbi:protein of unknown function (plasmid) [Azospirillum baldaniorum]|uniref:Uncharacterized protein n=1 Tax=Azospirillum baldaniorum TaxID=1064539 RepID=A0A9P1K1V7_9PROT|nr:protein of unknown function [Azospirillum baldaniorum]